MIIRAATLADAAAIARVQVEGWQTTYRGILADEFLDAMSVEKQTAQWTEALANSDNILLVADDGHIVGFAAAGTEQTGNPRYQGELFAIYVFSDLRGAGVGRQLISHAARALLAAGKRSMLVWALADNPFRRFYESLGGTLVTQQEIEIGRRRVLEVAYGWNDLTPLAAPRPC